MATTAPENLLFRGEVLESVVELNPPPGVPGRLRASGAPLFSRNCSVPRIGYPEPLGWCGLTAPRARHRWKISV